MWEYMPIVGGLVGGALGNPIVEVIKDKIGARRSWRTERRTILAAIRRTLAVIEAFEEVKLLVVPTPSGSINDEVWKGTYANYYRFAFVFVRFPTLDLPESERSTRHRLTLPSERPRPGHIVAIQSTTVRWFLVQARYV